MEILSKYVSFSILIHTYGRRFFKCLFDFFVYNNDFSIKLVGKENVQPAYLVYTSRYITFGNSFLNKQV